MTHGLRAAIRGGWDRWRLTLPVALLLALPMPALAQVANNTAPLQFTDQAEARRFHDMAGQLRCVMCQNQSLADSNAEIARDLRHEVLELMRQGKTDVQIKQFLVVRYGEFVLYRPRMEATTWLLWFGPALVLLAGGFLVAGAVRKRSTRAPVAPDQDNQEW